MKYFFTADTHFGHANIIKYCNRPFETTSEHDAVLIHRWNSLVERKDMVYHLGDFAFGEGSKDFDKYFEQLNGNIVFIKGNHDKLAWRNRGAFAGYHYGFAEEEINGQRIVLCHYAMRRWNASHYGTWHLYGHSHGQLPDDPHSLSIDVGVDCHNFTPVSFERVAELMAKKFFVPIDKATRQASGGVGLPAEEFAREERRRMYEQLKKEFGIGVDHHNIDTLEMSDNCR